jgi:hypothetical protein
MYTGVYWHVILKKVNSVLMAIFWVKLLCVQADRSQCSREAFYLHLLG